MEEENKGIKLILDYLPSYGYVLVQNKVAVCRDCTIEIGSGQGYESLDISLEGDGFEDSSECIHQPEQGRIRLNSLQIIPKEDLLLELETEEERTFTIKVDSGGEVVFQQSYKIKLYPYDYWVGADVMSQMLASYVLSNEPLLSRVALKVAELLEKWTGSSSLSEYQSQDPNIVRYQVAAVYEALRAESLVYASIPPSFVSDGQRVRLAEEVLTSKIGNCLDLTLLFAACLEYIGLNPLLVMAQGHIFVGAWLINEVYPYFTGDDASFLLKASADGVSEIVLVESTCITASQAIPFEEAVRRAENSLREEGYMRFFVDVRRCRLGRVYPLRKRVREGNKWIVSNKGLEREELKHKINHLQRYELQFTEAREATRQVVWERKLLDMSLRNNLLNLRIGQRVLPLISFNIDEWEDHLQSDGSFQILGNPSETIPQLTKGGIYNSYQYETELADLVLEDLKGKRLHSFVKEEELEESLKSLHRNARLALEENGANSLFLALGIMKWFETDQSSQARYAPILLLPIEITRQRPSSGGAYSIKARGEDIIPNITLLEMLKQKFDLSIDPAELLQQDKSGIDVMSALSALKALIKELKGWDILSEAMIGLFSFSKFVMWNDLHNNAHKLRESSIIRGLMDITTPENLEGETVDAREIDRNALPQDLLLPIDVDSSQLEAIVEAGRGRSFVLHGPPGTGKSQTITNMIAYALSLGKRVLFVAEKMAALSVVQSRLERIGLGAFCLELHSNKTTKSHILEQLARPLELRDSSDSQAYQRLSAQLAEQRQRLLRYVEALHEKQSTGYSLYEHINAYLAIEEEGKISLLKEELEKASIDTLQRVEGEVSVLETLFTLSGHPYKHPLAFLDMARQGLMASPELKGNLEQYGFALQRLDERRRQLVSMLNIDIPDTFQALKVSLKLCQSLLADSLQDFEVSQLKMYSKSEFTRAWDKAVEETIKEEALAEELNAWSQKYNRETGLKTNKVEQLCESWRAASAQWFLPRFFARRSILKSSKQSLNNPQLSESDLDTLVVLEDRRQMQKHIALDATPDLVQTFCGEYRLPIASVRERYSYGKAIYDALEGLASQGGSSLLTSLTTFDSLFKLDWQLKLSELRPHLDEYREAFNSFRALHEQLGSILSSAVTESKAFIEDLVPQIETAVTHIAGLRDWSRWCDKRSQLQRAGLEVLVRVLETSSLQPQEAYRQIAKSMHLAWAEQIIAREQTLASFSGLLFDQVVEKYRQYQRQFQEVSKEELLARLIMQVPPAESIRYTGEITFLKRNLSNKGRGKSIRDILNALPNLLPHLAPCMLMSPLSVAQYLSLEQAKFDLVIFDEASQMPTSEAIGAIARGNSLVVVGDPKQMPPTSFFASTQMEEELAELDDMESILDDCIALSMPSRYLTWHYRSKHESLIAFSNSQYYGDKLNTFPSTDDMLSRVRLVRIEGTYDKGASRSNKAEAEAVVSEIIRRLSDENLRRQSIGVVAFNQSQQYLIEDLLMKEFSKHHDLEQIALQSEEPIFIKNLENVQGDERDLILFSVGYGPDKEGKLSMNFGPLNQQGGERRLNVAVSRARYEMLVFSTMGSEHIDLKRTQAKGVEGLKLFLEFAERGQISTHSSREVVKASSLALSLAKDLKERGYQVNTSVGRSDFKIDLAILDPSNPERYLLGILCDGDGYYRTKTTQDRELVQPGVLSMLGWNVMRLWSVDYLLDRERVLTQIESKLEALMTN